MYVSGIDFVSVIFLLGVEDVVFLVACIVLLCYLYVLTSML
jgi:hypothetical protein